MENCDDLGSSDVDITPFRPLGSKTGPYNASLPLSSIPAGNLLTAIRQHERIICKDKRDYYQGPQPSIFQIFTSQVHSAGKLWPTLPRRLDLSQAISGLPLDEFR